MSGSCISEIANWQWGWGGVGRGGAGTAGSRITLKSDKSQPVNEEKDRKGHVWRLFHGDITSVGRVLATEHV